MRWSLKRMCALVWHSRYPALEPCSTNKELTSALLVQYYSLANCTILFYDYFLTLSDEVRRDHPPGTSWFPAETGSRQRSNMHGLERSRGVCAPLETSFLSADPLRTAFWIFLLVRIVSSLWSPLPLLTDGCRTGTFR